MDRRIIGLGIVVGTFSLAAVASAEGPKPVTQASQVPSQAAAPAKVKKVSTQRHRVGQGKKAMSPSAAVASTETATGKKPASTTSTGAATTTPPAK